MIGRYCSIVRPLPPCSAGTSSPRAPISESMGSRVSTGSRSLSSICRSSGSSCAQMRSKISERRSSYSRCSMNSRLYRPIGLYLNMGWGYRGGSGDLPGQRRRLIRYGHDGEADAAELAQLALHLQGGDVHARAPDQVIETAQ